MDSSCRAATPQAGAVPALAALLADWCALVTSFADSFAHEHRLLVLVE